MVAAKPLRIRFDKTDAFVRVFDGTRYLLLLEAGKLDSIYNRIGYKKWEQKLVLHILFLIIMWRLSLAETLTFHNVIKHIKSVRVKDKNNYYYNIFLEKCLYELPKNNNKL